MLKTFVAILTLALAACAGRSPSLAPAGSLVPQAVAQNETTSWVSPQAAKAASLLYVGNESYVSIYTYDNGVAGNLVGKLGGFADMQGLCADKAGDVWVVEGTPNYIIEYAHGGAAPIASINRHRGHGVGCAVNPTNGDLAVADNYTPKGGLLYGSVDVYAHAQPKEVHEYTNSTGLAWAYFVAYDNAGNLYGYGCYYNSCRSGANPLMVLKPGGSTFNPVTIDGVQIQNPTGLSWVNPTLLIGNSSYATSTAHSVGYKLLVQKNSAKLVQTIPYAGTHEFWGSTVRAGNIIVPDYSDSVVRTYSLADGSLISTLKKDVVHPFSVVVSQAK